MFFALNKAVNVNIINAVLVGIEVKLIVVDIFELFFC